MSLISVVMPVFNTEPYIKEAVDSILNQSFSDFEFIIVDDLSTDNSMQIVDSIIDNRIIKIKKTSHEGNFRCRNHGLATAKGKYICIMDSDDIAHRDRFKKQFEFMETNREYIAAGTFVERFNAEGYAGIWKFHTDSDSLKTGLLKDSVYCHPSLIFRKEAYSRYGIKYNSSYYYAGDYDFMLSLSRIGQITNMEDILLKYRLHAGQITRAKRQEQINFADCIRLKQLDFFKIRPNMEEIMLHLRLMKFLPVSGEDLTKAEKWLNKLLVKNHRLNVYSEELLYDLFNIVLMNAKRIAF
jgi:glycosyltransferase involved in cell wall biosynthesis